MKVLVNDNKTREFNNVVQDVPFSSDFDGRECTKLSVQINGAASGSAEESFIDGVLASGTITVTSFAAGHLTAASGTVTVVDFNNLAGKVLTVAGHALTEGVDWTAATDNDTTADSLASAINALTEVNAANPAAAAITVVAATAGTVGNAITLVTSDAVNLTISGATLTGGINACTVTVAGHVGTESTNFNFITDNNTAADNLASWIDSLSETQAANPAAAVITVKAATVGTAGNSITTAVSGGGVTAQQATLGGGLNSDVDDAEHTITIPGHGWSTGLNISYDVDSGTTLDNLVDTQSYFVITIDEDTIQLAATQEDAEDGDEILIAAADNAIGGGSFTLSSTGDPAMDFTYTASNDGETFVTLNASEYKLSGSGNSILVNFGQTSFVTYRIGGTVTSGEADVTLTPFAAGIY